MRRVGVMGGTFDPIHIGHVEIAQAAKDYLILDEVWFMPAGDPPHKDDKVISKEHRIEMVKLAIYGEEGFFLSTHETDLDRLSYSAITMKELSEQFEDCEFYFIMGADSFMSFDKWYQPEEICKYCHLAVAGRNDIDEEEMKNKASEYEAKFNSKTFFVDFNEINISSSDIRKAFADGDEEDIKEFLNSDVYEYIEENNLYKGE